MVLGQCTLRPKPGRNIGECIFGVSEWDDFPCP